MLLDWAHLERWCRDLTLSFTDVYVFTIPLYLPKMDADGKWRVVCLFMVFARSSC
jgi:endonuclease G, mitochondrial